MKKNYEQFLTFLGHAEIKPISAGFARSSCLKDYIAVWHPEHYLGGRVKNESESEELKFLRVEMNLKSE